MKVSKWVDFGQEVDVDINLQDISAAIGEAWERVTVERFEEEPTRNDVIQAMSRSLTYFKALKDEQIALLLPEQRQRCAELLSETADRFKVGGLFKPSAGGGKQVS